MLWELSHILITFNVKILNTFWAKHLYSCPKQIENVFMRVPGSVTSIWVMQNPVLLTSQINVYANRQPSLPVKSILHAWNVHIRLCDK